MFDIFKRKTDKSEIENKPQNNDENTSLLTKLKEGLAHTSARLSESLTSLFLGKKAIDAELLEQLETILLSADLGPEVTHDILAHLTAKLSRHEIKDPTILLTYLKEELLTILTLNQQPLLITKHDHNPFMILVIGVNGAGKTTTIGKLAYKFTQEGKKVMLAAGDTFRAAAVEQLQVWGEKNAIPVISQHANADSASVIFDALNSATAKNIDVLIADTAGRLHNKEHLMLELKKITRVTQKLNPQAPHATLLVLDASTVQNALIQAMTFSKEIGVTGLILTKLDGTAKGGIIFAIAKKLALPIYFIGVGEQLEDLQVFDPQSFIEALFATTKNKL